MPPATSVYAMVMASRTAEPVAVTLRQVLASSTAAMSVPTGNIESTKEIVIPGVTNSYVTVPGNTIDLVLSTCTQTITPDANGYVPPGTCGAIWQYYPSFTAAATFAVLFFLLTMIHIWQAAKYKRKWCWVIIMANIWETIAFTFRAISTRNQQSSGIYLIFQIFILLAPLWFNAFAYMVLGRMIQFFHPSQALFHIPAPVIAAVFVLLDVVSFVVQLVGGTMASPTASPGDLKKAIDIYMAGIGLQQSFITLFICLAVKLQIELRRILVTLKSQTKGATSLLLALYLSLAMITVRIIYRLMEFSSGSIENPLTTQEAYFFILEATPMFIASVVFIIVHPGAIITGPKSDIPSLWSTLKGMLSGDRDKILLDDRDGQELTGLYTNQQ